jgi:magnesium transporter
MITHYFKTVQDTELKTLDSVRTGVWTHVVNPTDEEIELIAKEFVLDVTVLEDARDFFEVPRMERKGGVTYFFTRYPFDEKDEDSGTAPLLIVIGESFILTLSVREVPQFIEFFECREPFATTQKAKFFIQIMDSITFSYERELVRFRKLVQKDRARLRRLGSRQIERLVDFENDLNDMIAALVPTNIWLQQVTTGNYMQLYNEDVELMNDLMIANSQLVESARSVLKTIQNIRTATEAILTNKLNNTIRTLTILTIILTIPTIVASLFGMNVKVPFGESQYAFFMVLGFIAVVVLGVVWLFKRNKWL